MDVKPATTYLQQVEILRSRGLQVENETFALSTLQRINYYRLTGYTLTVRDACTEQFREGITFRHVARLYDFDQRLRHVLSGVLESIEVAFRDRVAYVLAHQVGPLGYMDSRNFKNAEYHAAFIRDLDDEIAKSQEIFVQHHIENYGGQLPVWVAIEVLSFGVMSLLYKNMKDTEQIAVGTYYNTKEPYLSTWVHAAVRLRNICAHYGRLYGRTLSPIVQLYKWQTVGLTVGSLAPNLMALKGVCPDPNEWTTFVNSVKTLVEEYEDVVELEHLGLSDGWFRRLVAARPK